MIEKLLFDLAQAFWWPIMLLVLLSFGYAILKLGGFLVESFQRMGRPNRILILPAGAGRSLEEMELIVLGELEGLKLCSRVAPMLGLVATMIPLGPALAAVSAGQTDTAAAGLADAFATAIVALVAASIAFAIYTVRRRWLLQELSYWMETQS